MAPPPGAPAGVPTSLPDLDALGPSFAVFEGEREPADEVSPKLIPQATTETLGLDVSASRFSRRIQGNPFFLVPGIGMVCLYGRSDAIGSCWPPRIVREGRAVASALCGPGRFSDRVFTFGIVPDGVGEVTIVRTNVPSATVPVHGNVFVGATSSKPPLPLRVRWEVDGEWVIRSSGIPAKVAREGC